MIVKNNPNPKLDYPIFVMDVQTFPNPDKCSSAKKKCFERAALLKRTNPCIRVDPVIIEEILEKDFAENTK